MLWVKKLKSCSPLFKFLKISFLIKIFLRLSTERYINNLYIKVIKIFIY